MATDQEIANELKSVLPTLKSGTSGNPIVAEFIENVLIPQLESPVQVTNINDLTFHQHWLKMTMEGFKISSLTRYKFHTSDIHRTSLSFYDNSTNNTVLSITYDINNTTSLTTAQKIAKLELFLDFIINIDENDVSTHTFAVSDHLLYGIQKATLENT